MSAGESLGNAPVRPPGEIQAWFPQPWLALTANPDEFGSGIHWRFRDLPVHT